MNQEPEPGLLTLLEKVLKAVHHDRYTDALTVFLTGNQKFSFSGFAKKHGIQKALFFGLTPARASLNINPRIYLPSNLGEQVLLFAHDLSVIAQDNKLKAQLWRGLQLMFPESS